MLEELSNLTEVSVQELKTLAKKNFYFFAKAILGFADLSATIHKPLCDLLQETPDGGRSRIILPRGWFKTTVCSIAFPIWRALNDPNITVLIVQNTATNAESKLRSIRGVFENNELFRTLFRELLPSKDSIWTKTSLCVSRPSSQKVESTFEAAGVNTQVVSRHYDLIIEDDTVAPDLNELGEESLAPSKADIEQAIGWHRLATPLLVNPAISQIIVVGTRWFDKDLLSWIGDREKHYRSYIRACREDALGNSTPLGELTYPERFTAKVLEELEAALGPYMFACLYLNNPLRASDMIFLAEWFEYYEEEPRQRLDVFTVIDTAGDPEEQTTVDSDYNVVMTSGKCRKTGKIYVLDYWRGRANPGTVLDELFRQVRVWRPLKVGVEHVAYSNTFSYWCKERMRQENLFFLIEGIKHKGKAKNLRIQGLQPLFASGSILLRRWMCHLVQELQAFPLGRHDDLADTLAMHMGFWTLTEMKKREVQSDIDGPFGLVGVIEELRTKAARIQENLVDLSDILQECDAFSMN